MKKTIIAAIAVVSLLSSSLIVSAAPNGNANENATNNSNRSQKAEVALENNMGQKIASEARNLGERMQNFETVEERKNQKGMKNFVADLIAERKASRDNSN